VHRDIKPSNIIVKPDGRICLIDFGIVKDMKHSTGQTITQIIGTDGYMSPEQAAPATIDYRSDIYSLGCLLYYMLVGNHAIQKQSNDHATKMTILKSAFPKAQHFNPNLSNHIQQILDKATDKNMLRRFQSCREFELKIGSGATVVGVENFRPLQYQIDHTISVGRQNCDIIVYDPTEKVSRHHLDIIKMQCPPEEVDTIHFLIRDRSTNGTTISFHFGNYVNSEKIHSTETMIDVNADEYTPNYPKILLAGKVELNWSDVEAAFARKRNATKSSVINTPPPAPSIDEAKKARRKSAIPEIIGGIVLIAVGVILTVISLSSDSRIGYVFYGLVAAGAVSVIKGIRSMKPANSTAGSMYQQAREGQSAAGWLVAIYILAFCGLLGFLGLFFGIMVYCSKITLPDGQKTPKYKKSHRTAALIVAILSAVLMIAIIIILSYI
jgi:serine/threonine-protein kinase